MSEKKPLRVAIIGISPGMGKLHLEAVLEHGAEVRAVCDTNPETLKTVCDELGIPEERRFADYHAFLNDPELDAVIVATPDQVHREISTAFLDAGKHVMCEKPLALNREDMEAIVACARKHPQQKFMVGQICRFTPAFVKAKEIIDAGTIGELYYVESEYAHDYAKLLHAWRKDPNRHGVVGGGCHAVDLLRWYAGDPLEVFAYGAHKLLPEVSYDDATISVLKFPNGIIGKVFVSTGCKRPYTMRTQLFGTKGTILCDNTSDHMTLYVVDKDGVDLAEPQTIPIEIKNHNAGLEFEVFAKTIEKDEPVAMDGVQGAKTIACCLAIVESAKTGKPVAPNYNF